MKLKNLKKGDKGKKESKTQQVKQKIQETTNIAQDQEQVDDVLIDLQADINKKQQPKKNIKTRIQTNKLVQNQIDTSKLVIQKKQEQKKPITTWVVDNKDIDKMLAKDFKLQQVDHQFESLTDNKINQELKKKKVDVVGGFKFAPISLGGSLVDNKNTDKLVLSKPKYQNQSSIPINAPILHFTNTKLNENVQLNQIQKTPQQIREQQMELKMKERQAQRAKLTSQINPVSNTGAGKNMWARKNTNEVAKQPVKQAPKIQFKSSPLTFTNSALNNNNIQFKPLQKTAQQKMMQTKQQEFKLVNKKQQQQRKKKRQAQMQLKVQKV